LVHDPTNFFFFPLQLFILLILLKTQLLNATSLLLHSDVLKEIFPCNYRSSYTSLLFSDCTGTQMLLLCHLSSDLIIVSIVPLKIKLFSGCSIYSHYNNNYYYYFRIVILESVLSNWIFLLKIELKGMILSIYSENT
jgi:hypothetical protein